MKSTNSNGSDGTSADNFQIHRILEALKQTTDADDARFRVRDWKDQSMVYVKHWIIGSILDNSEPALAQRYYDNRRFAEDSSIPPFDCYVGLVGLAASPTSTCIGRAIGCFWGGQAIDRQ